MTHTYGERTMEHKELTAANVRMPITKAAAIWTEYSGGPAIQKATLVRWITEGVNGHRLKAERFGGRWFCTPADLADLHRRLNESSGSGPRDHSRPTTETGTTSRCRSGGQSHSPGNRDSLGNPMRDARRRRGKEPPPPG